MVARVGAEVDKPRTRRRVRVTEEDSSRAVLEPSTGLGVMPTKHAETTAARERAKANARNPAGRPAAAASERPRAPVASLVAPAGYGSVAAPSTIERVSAQEVMPRRPSQWYKPFAAQEFVPGR